jgi:hypothetical protein
LESGREKLLLSLTTGGDLFVVVVHLIIFLSAGGTLRVKPVERELLRPESFLLKSSTIYAAVSSRDGQPTCN